jgi:hypothetical protein
MMIREAMSVFWQALKDTWEELFSLAIVNLVWLASILTVILIPVTTAGMYYVTNRVAHGKTFHFSDFIEGIKLFWWRSLLWFLANILIVFLVIMNLQFYASFQATWSVFVNGLWLAVLAFWLSMQLYFWPLLIEQEQPKMLLTWRNCAYLILANPFYGFFMVCFTIVLFAVSVALTLPLIFVGMALVGLLGNNAVLTLLVKFGIIKEARPKTL